jgi:hypothetical protein
VYFKAKYAYQGHPGHEMDLLMTAIPLQRPHVPPFKILFIMKTRAVAKRSQDRAYMILNFFRIVVGVVDILVSIRMV